jgi:PAS domain S-box-containing protein
MSALLLELEQVLTFFERPAFLLRVDKNKLKVIGFNDKLNQYSKLKTNPQKEEGVRPFLINTFGLNGNACKTLIEQLSIESKSTTSDSIHIQTEKESFIFKSTSLKLQDQSFLFVALESNHQSKAISTTKELEFFKQIFESLPMGVSVNKIDDSVSLYMNKKFIEIYGWDLDDLKDVSTFFEKVYPVEAYRKEVSERVMQNIESGDASQMEWKNITITTKSGEKKIVNAKNIPLFEQNLMISTVVDVTESSATKHELARARTRFDLAAQATSDAVWEWNLNEDELYWSDGYERLFGYKTKDNKVSKSFWESKIHPNDFDPFFESLNEALEDKSLNKWTFAYRFQNRKGNYAHVRENIIIVRDGNGKPIRLIGALQDISKLLKRENHLDLLEKLVGSTKDSIIVSEVKSDSFFESEIIYANSSFQKLFGFEVSEILGKTPKEFYVTSKNEEKFLKLEEELSQWVSVDEVVLSLTKGDVEFWNNISITPIMNDQGWYTHWMIVNRDINALKTNEEKRELLVFTHKAFEGSDALENVLCKIALKIEDLVRTKFCEFWLVDHYSKKLTKSLSFKNGKLIEQGSKFADLYSKDFAQEIFEKHTPIIKTHKDKTLPVEEEAIKLSYGFQIRSRGEAIGVVILGFDDTYSRLESLNAIFEEFSVQLANEIVRKRTENELSTFFEYTPGLLCIAGGNGYLKRINERASDILGYSQEEFMTIPFLNFVVEEDREATMDLIKTAKTKKGFYSKELCIIAKNSQIFQVDWTVFSLEDSEDVFCIGRDVTAYKENISILKTQYEKFKIIAETVKDAVWDYDLKNNKITWGSGLQKLFGYNPNKFNDAEEAWLEKIHPKDRSSVKKSFDNFLNDKAKKDWSIEYRFKKQDGSYANVLDTGSVIRDPTGEPLRVVGSLQDITEFR